MRLIQHMYETQKGIRYRQSLKITSYNLQLICIKDFFSAKTYLAVKKQDLKTSN